MKRITIIISLALLVLTPLILGYELSSHPSGAMRPTISMGSYILSKSHSLTPSRGLIVVYNHPLKQDQKWVGRIIGLPNEAISIDQNGTYIDGNILDEPYLDKKYLQTRRSLLLNSVKLNKNQFFIMGDARDNSEDSRYFGPVSSEDITSEVLQILF